MRNPFLLSLVALTVMVGLAPAFEVEAILKNIDGDKGVIVFFAKDQDRKGKLAKDLKVFDAAGKELADGLKSKELKEGTVVVLSIERVDNEPMINRIRLGKVGGTPKAPVVESKDFKVPNTANLKPLTEMGAEKYQGFAGGLYPDGDNKRPAEHETAGLERARQIRRLDKDGKASDTGKIVVLTIGFSNTFQASKGFLDVAAEDKTIHPQVVLVNGAVGGMNANAIQTPDEGKGKKYWATVDERLQEKGVTRAQVQAVWLKETNPGPHPDDFPKVAQDLQAEIGNIVRLLHVRCPNLKNVYLSSRTYAGWARPNNGRGPGNSEPYSYETGFAVKWLIEQQLKGDPTLNFDAKKGDVKAPWLSWGPYLWANGVNKRSDGFCFEKSDFRDDDQMHHSLDGMKKMGNALLQFFHHDPTTRPWFTNPSAER